MEKKKQFDTKVRLPLLYSSNMYGHFYMMQGINKYPRMIIGKQMYQRMMGRWLGEPPDFAELVFGPIDENMLRIKCRSPFYTFYYGGYAPYIHCYYYRPRSLWMY